MPPQLVNAVNLPVRNSLNFPAAIHASAVFDPKAPSAANYGRHRAVIGHRDQPLFDDQVRSSTPRQAPGLVERRKIWRTFEASSAALAAQFDAYKPVPDVSVNGKLTLGENIADLGGISAAFDAWRASLHEPRPGGFRPPTARAP